MDFRAKTKTDAMSLAKAWVDHLVAPMHVEIDVSEDGVHLVKAEAHGDHIHQALEAAFT
jgi:hypothetical protein